MKAPVVVYQPYYYVSYVRTILFLLCCILPNSGAVEEEVSALLDIKSGFNHTSPLPNLHDWKLRPFTSHAPLIQPLHCNWTGVSCDSAGFVERLDLSGMNLTGTISASIARLSRLVYLNLCCNSLSSFLPKYAFANLTLLKQLDVSDNSFVGEFPLGLGGAVGLTLVNASGNDFTGNLPGDLGNVTGLEVLDFRGSYFQGSIPESYKMLKNLKYLGLSGNNLSGRLPSFLGEMSGLEKLIIGYNLFDGTLPKEIGKLKKLRYLDIAVGNFTGGVPHELGSLEQLQTIFLYKNKFDGEIPKQLGNISTLVFLDLSDNSISGEIPVELGKLENLELLNLMCNKLVGRVPAELSHLRRLKVLELWNNELTGHLPEKLGSNSSLRWFDVSSNSLSGGIPVSLCDGKNLTKLILFNNDFTGSIPASLTKCHTLVRVRIHNNRLNGTIPDGFGKLPNLQRLELAGNEITGTIPDDFSSSLSLSFIDISRNRIHMALPSTIFSIPNLQTFIASDNEIAGEIPDQFQDCLFLTELNLSNNRHTGRIPATVTSCNRLVNLDLSNNGLTGEIPRAVAMMPSLSILDLSFNKLSGSIPPDLGTSPALETLNVSYNNLSGPVPINGVLRTIDPADLTGNTGLCGGVLPPCSGFFTPKGLRNVHFKHIILGLIVGISAVFSIGMLLLGLKWMYQKWRLEGDGVLFFRSKPFARESGEWPWRITAFQRLSFTSSEVLACVTDSNVIGMGATGIVYKAEMPRHHTTVAVKKLWKSELDTELSDKNAGVDIAGEANLLGRLRHRNIVQILGFLHNNNDVMIVYEYMPNGNLWDALHGRDEKKNIANSPAPPPTAGMLVDWVSRYNVATGVAHALAYLHHDCRPPVIHRDIKSNNILLDANLEARIADFGLAKTLLRKNETISIIVGSYGYIAPEYGYTAKVDQKSDIYSFGVVLMELVTGKKPIDSELFGDSQDIVGWVREKLRVKGGIGEVLDRTICGQCQHIQDEMVMVLRIAMLCTAKLPKDRPSSRDVLSMLGEAKPRRKSSSSSSTAVKEKPVFTTAPESDYL